MMYTGHDGQEQAQLECDLLNRRHVKLGTGRTWEPKMVAHAGWRDICSREYWQPQEVVPTDHGELAMHARRTCFHVS